MREIMREIKFRVWDKENKRMSDCRTVSSVIRWEPTKNYDLDFKYELEFWHPVEGEQEGREITEYEIMQYTGLKDKNGVEIYEGDIVDFECSFILREVEGVKQFISEVYYSPGGFFVHTKQYPKGIPIYKRLKIEIIGNIYENPELLK